MLSSAVKGIGQIIKSLGAAPNKWVPLPNAQSAIHVINKLSIKHQNKLQLPQVDSTETVLYPSSGADVCYPLTIFANASRFVFIDMLPFLPAQFGLVNSEQSQMICNADSIQKIEQYFDMLHTNAGISSIGYFGSGVGYDITDPIEYLAYRDVL